MASGMESSLRGFAGTVQTSAGTSTCRPTRLWPRLAGSPAGQAVPLRLEASASPAATGEAAATSTPTAARAVEGCGEPVDVGRRSHSAGSGAGSMTRSSVSRHVVNGTRARAVGLTSDSTVGRQRGCRSPSVRSPQASLRSSPPAVPAGIVAQAPPPKRGTMGQPSQCHDLLRVTCQWQPKAAHFTGGRLGRIRTCACRVSSLATPKTDPRRNGVCRSTTGCNPETAVPVRRAGCPTTAMAGAGSRTRSTGPTSKRPVTSSSACCVTPRRTLRRPSRTRGG